MTRTEAMLRELRPELKPYGIKRVWLFGSAVTEENPRDVDVLVEFAEPPGLLTYMGLKDFLEQRLGRPVDILSRSACQPHFLKRIQADLVDVA